MELLISKQNQILCSEQNRLFSKVIYVGWAAVLINMLLDIYNHTYISAGIMGFGTFVVHPVILLLKKRQQYELAKFLFLLSINLMVMFATVAFPVDDAGRFYFVPIGILSFLLLDWKNKKALGAGVIIPILFFVASIIFYNPRLPEHATNLNMSLETSRSINFLIIYAICVYFVFIFAKFLVKLQEITAHQNKFSALGMLSAGVAHEINNPLSVIHGKTHMLLKRLKNNNLDMQSLEKDFEVIIKTSERISKIVGELKTFSRDSSTDDFREVSAKKAIATTLALCQERIQEVGITLTVMDEVDFTFQGREGQIVQVLLNIIMNAVDAIEKQSDKWLKIEIAAKKIIITDSGPGIPKEIAEKLMQPFFTTKEVGKGIGLGLSLSKKIMEDHGGGIFLDRKSENTRFVIQFPEK